jgi:hypothetical protein
MKRFVLLAALALAAIVASQAFAAPSFTQATGDVTFAGPNQELAFNAFDYGTTGDRGAVTYTNQGVTSYQANVFCANVNSAGRWANFAYQIPAGTGQGLDGLYIVWQVKDGGSAGAGNDTAGFDVAHGQAEAASLCNSNDWHPTYYNFGVATGNLVVH